MTSLTSKRNDDDEEKLVKQVIEENPVADVGIRDEWVQKIGWHRKENLLPIHRVNEGHLLRGGSNSVSIQSQSGKINLVHQDHNLKSKNIENVSIRLMDIKIAIILVTLLILLWCLVRNIRRKKLRSS